MGLKSGVLQLRVGWILLLLSQKNRLYVGSWIPAGQNAEPSKVYCLDAITGTKIWEFKTEDGVNSSPAIADDFVYVAVGTTMFIVLTLHQEL